jgi:hypothetical protein
MNEKPRMLSEAVRTGDFQATRHLSAFLTVDEWELLGHGLATAAAHYRGDEGHPGVSDQLDALIMKLRRSMMDEGER